MRAEQTRKAGVEVWAYCLMPNHLHLTLKPEQADPNFPAMMHWRDGPGRAVGEGSNLIPRPIG